MYSNLPQGKGILEGAMKFAIIAMALLMAGASTASAMASWKPESHCRTGKGCKTGR